MGGKKVQQRKKQEMQIKRILYGIAFFALTIYTSWIIFQAVAEPEMNLNASLGFIGAFIYRTMATLSGAGKILFPLTFCLISVLAIMNKPLEKTQITGFAMLVIACLTFLHMDITFLSLASQEHSFQSLFGLGWEGSGGGIIGAICAWLLVKAFGKVGFSIVLFCLVIIAAVFISQETIAARGDSFAVSIRSFFYNLKEALYHFIFVEEADEEEVPEPSRQYRGRAGQAISYDAGEKKDFQRSGKEKPLIINNLTEIQKGLEQGKKRKEETEEEQQAPIKDAHDDSASEKAAPAKQVKGRKKKEEASNALSLKKAPTKTESQNSEPEVPSFTVKQAKAKEGASSIAEPEEKEFDIVLNSEVVYQFPSIDLLDESPGGNGGISQEAINQNVAILEKTLNDFGVKGHIAEVSIGPAITRYEFQPAAGVKVSRIVNLADDIALSMASAGVRIEAPIPGKPAVGIELPNKETTMVTLRELIESDVFQNSKGKLTVALGKDISGQPIVADLAKMPHLLIAGSTGSGKSVCMNALINSILYKASPDEVKFLMVDPKMVELGNYNGIPHLISPVVTDPKKAASALRWAVHEMERRYELFAHNGVKDMTRFNKLSVERRGTVASEEEKANYEILPYIVVLIDELADLMMVAPADVEDAICRLAQLARAAGIHLVVATQRPSVDVITGIIKANLPSRIAFAVSSQVDSRTILDMGGAEKLLGKGDMLFYPTGLPKPLRVQGVYVSDREIDGIVETIKIQGAPVYDESIAATPLEADSSGNGADDTDELIPEAVKLFIENGTASISLLQRRFRIGYNRAARIIDQMEQLGLVGPYEGSKPRQIRVTMEQYLSQSSDSNDLSGKVQ